MKKKLFLGALLLGALTLNSCVDNVESDSVKSIRQAKAEQLKAKAEYDKAQGEAALIAAQAAQKAQEIAAAAQAAQAEYMKAQAEYQRAMAAYYEAQAALENAKAESEKATAAQKAEDAALDLEIKKLTLEQKKADLENYKKKLAYLDAQYEQQLYDYQKKALEAKRALEKAIANGDQTKYDDLVKLLNQYNLAVTDLSQAQKELVQQKIAIAKYEAGITNGNDMLEWQIENKKDQIKTLQDQNEAWQAAIDTYETEQSYESAKADLEKVTKEIADLNLTKSQQMAEENGAKTKAANAKYNLDASDYVQAAQKVAALTTINNQTITSAGLPYTKTLSVTSTSTDPEAAGYVCAVIYDPSTSQSTYYRLFSDIDSEIKYLYYEEYQNTTQQSKRYTYYNEYYTLYKDGAGMDELIAAANDFVKNNQQKKYDDAAKAYDVQADTVKSVQKFYDTLVPLQEKYDEAYDAEQKAIADGKTGADLAPYTQKVSDAGDDFKDALEGKKKVGTAQTDYETMLPATFTKTNVDGIVTALETQLNTEKIDLNTTKLNTKNSTLNLLNTAKDEVADIEDYAKTLKAGNAANNEAVKAVNDANLAAAKAILAVKETDLEISIKTEVQTALNNIVSNNSFDSGKTIEDLKAAIKQNESTIGQYEAELAKFEKDAANNDFNNEELIEKAKIEVAELENKIALLEERVKLAKELLDAAMKAE